MLSETPMNYIKPMSKSVSIPHRDSCYLKLARGLNQEDAFNVSIPHRDSCYLKLQTTLIAFRKQEKRFNPS